MIILNIGKANTAPVRLKHSFPCALPVSFEKTGQRVVILVDEYDKPMLQAIGNEELQKQFQNTLRPFYGALKTKDGYIKFALLTGVTKFGKVSVFSDLNNLDDISMWNEYVEICGVSEREIHENLEAELHEFAAARGITYDRLCEDLRECYDGYHFTHNSIGMYNPFSLLNAFKRKEFGSYWFETGTPTYLVKLLKKHHYDLERMAHEETDVQVLNSIDSESTNPIPVIYQSGYLTIKGYDEEFGMYRLGFPNREVEEGFIRFLLPFYANVNKVEYHTSEGRIDLVLQTDKFIYIMEFKLNGTAEDALQQINDKNYALPFEMDGRKLFKIGVNFSAETRNIEKWIVETKN